MELKFERVAIINRGEPAMRAIHAIHEYNLEHGTRIKSIAFYVHSDKNSMFYRKADESYCIGDATFRDPKDGVVKASYLDYERLEKALVETHADAVWAGWGFVAEQADFVDLCEKNGLIFIGPSASVMRNLGDKISSKHFAREAQVPMAPWSEGAVETLQVARMHAERLGYPLMIKASAGGGGRGIRMVCNEQDLSAHFENARQEALKYFGDATVFLERYIEKARHVEVQILGDQHGTVWALGVRDCTIQRRYQKILEESPSPVLTQQEDLFLRESAVKLCQSVRYENVGTVEFLFDPQSRNLFFLEVNTRLQVEHPVTELTTGLDLVKTQFFIAQGGKLEGPAPQAKGHAIEVRLNAEDPVFNFSPSPGIVEKFLFHTGPGIRIDTGIMEGDEIPSQFDSNVAKILAYGKDRNEALARLKRVLSHMLLIIRGGASNKGFLCELLDMPEIKTFDYDTAWLDGLIEKGDHISNKHADIALLQAAVEDYLTAMQTEKAQFLNSAKRGRPEIRKESGVKVELEYLNHSYQFFMYRLGVYHYRVDFDGRQIYLFVESLGEIEWNLKIGNERFRVFSKRQEPIYWVQVEGIPYRIARSQGGVLRATAPAVVAAVLVKPGDRVKTGQRLIVLEAMKMEMSLMASYSGTIKEVFVRNYMQVPPQEPLMLIEPDRKKQELKDTSEIRFDRFGISTEKDSDPSALCAQNVEELKSLLRGFDEDASEVKRLMEERSELCLKIEPEFRPLLDKEDELLNIFVDVIALFRKDPSVETAGPLSTQEYLLAYLLNPDEVENLLPIRFIKKLKRALTHYDVRDIKPSPELEFALFRICKSYQRMAQQLAPILSILERRLENVSRLKPLVNLSFQMLLDRLITETQGRFLEINDLAIQVRHYYFVKPMLAASQKQDLDKVDAHLKFLENHPDHRDRILKIEELVQCPQSIMAYLTGKFKDASVELKKVMLEVMARRYYRIRHIENVRTTLENGQCVATLEYNFETLHYHVLTTYVDLSRISENLNQLKAILERIPSGDEVLIDFYADYEGSETVKERIDSFLNQEKLPECIFRMVFAVATKSSERDVNVVRLHTYYKAPQGGYEEKTFYRDLHPMLFDRLKIWRLKNFDIERLPSTEDVYLYRGVAETNPKDRRLFAFAEIRDLTIVRRDSGNRVSLPSLERTLLEVLSSMRRIQSKQPPRQRYVWNRVYLYVWPVFDLQATEIKSLVSRLVTATKNLAIEKVLVRVLMPQSGTDELKEQIIEISNPAGGGLVTRFKDPEVLPIQPLTPYKDKVVTLQQRGLVYPYELVKMLTPFVNDTQSKFPPGEFQEYDLDEHHQLIPVQRAPGLNTANIIVGVITNFTDKYPEGMKRVILLGDPSRSMGSLAEPECRRINAGLDLARELDVPLEWMAVSAGALISMESGTENMDWIGLTLRRIIEFTQEGRPIHIVVNGINVGAQPYFNAEATMLMHNKGILIMTPLGAMVLTGKQALDYSGGVSAEDNFGIGGYERVMGPNGQAQYFARNIGEACEILFRYYEHSYRLPGERFPRSKPTTDPVNRDVCTYPHGNEFQFVGEIFSNETNPGRKRPFEIRKVMKATIDQDHPHLERWFGMQDAEIAVVWDAHIGGIPVCLLGFESQPLQRLRFVPADGPSNWTSGTLFPLASKKIARSINSASHNRPLVVLANLSGFDGSPESMRKWQLENGAEIGRAVVNFGGPIVFVVISRYHGGAFVVFSNALNDSMEVIALEGTYASVIGGSPAAAVVFAREVAKLTKENSQLKALEKQIAETTGAEKIRLRAQWNDLYQSVHSEELGKMATKFDGIHSVQRAEKVGSVNKIIPPTQLRPYIVERLVALMEKEIKPS